WPGACWVGCPVRLGLRTNLFCTLDLCWESIMPDNLLEVKDLNVYYDQSHILQGVDLVVGTEPVAIVGRNGMGKTTLCKALMGLVPITKGNISFAGTQLV